MKYFYSLFILLLISCSYQFDIENELYKNISHNELEMTNLKLDFDWDKLFIIRECKKNDFVKSLLIDYKNPLGFPAEDSGMGRKYIFIKDHQVVNYIIYPIITYKSRFDFFSYDFYRSKSCLYDYRVIKKSSVLYFIEEKPVLYLKLVE